MSASGADHIKFSAAKRLLLKRLPGDRNAIGCISKTLPYLIDWLMSWFVNKPLLVARHSPTILIVDTVIIDFSQHESVDFKPCKTNEPQELASN